MYYKIMH